MRHKSLIKRGINFSVLMTDRCLPVKVHLGPYLPTILENRYSLALPDFAIFRSI